MIRPITWAEVPSLIGSANDVITNSSATASSTSGMTNDTSISMLAPDGSRPRQRSMPIANITPSGTVISVAMTPSFSVCNSAWCSVASCHTDRVGSPQYQRNEKPCHVVRDLPSLNENITAISTGSSDQTR